jgi:hypothetical protein
MFFSLSYLPVAIKALLLPWPAGVAWKCRWVDPTAGVKLHSKMHTLKSQLHQPKWTFKLFASETIAPGWRSAAFGVSR